MKRLKKSGRAMPDLSPPNLPNEIAYLWPIYIEVFSGSDTVTFTSIDAYQKVTGYELNSWEASLLIEMDKTRARETNVN